MSTTIPLAISFLPPLPSGAINEDDPLFRMIPPWESAKYLQAQRNITVLFALQTFMSGVVPHYAQHYHLTKKDLKVVQNNCATYCYFDTLRLFGQDIKSEDVQEALTHFICLRALFISRTSCNDRIIPTVLSVRTLHQFGYDPSYEPNFVRFGANNAQPLFAANPQTQQQRQQQMQQQRQDWLNDPSNLSIWGILDLFQHNNPRARASVAKLCVSLLRNHTYLQSPLNDIVSRPTAVVAAPAATTGNTATTAGNNNKYNNFSKTAKECDDRAAESIQRRTERIQQLQQNAALNNPNNIRPQLRNAFDETKRIYPFILERIRDRFDREAGNEDLTLDAYFQACIDLMSEFHETELSAVLQIEEEIIQQRSAEEHKKKSQLGPNDMGKWKRENRDREFHIDLFAEKTDLLEQVSWIFASIEECCNSRVGMIRKIGYEAFLRVFKVFPNIFIITSFAPLIINMTSSFLPHLESEVDGKERRTLLPARIEDIEERREVALQARRQFVFDPVKMDYALQIAVHVISTNRYYRPRESFGGGNGRSEGVSASTMFVVRFLFRHLSFETLFDQLCQREPVYHQVLPPATQGKIGELIQYYLPYCVERSINSDTFVKDIVSLIEKGETVVKVKIVELVRDLIARDYPKFSVSFAVGRFEKFGLVEAIFSVFRKLDPEQDPVSWQQSRLFACIAVDCLSLMATTEGHVEFKKVQQRTIMARDDLPSNEAREFYHFFAELEKKRIIEIENEETLDAEKKEDIANNPQIQQNVQAIQQQRLQQQQRAGMFAPMPNRFNGGGANLSILDLPQRPGSKFMEWATSRAGWLPESIKLRLDLEKDKKDENKNDDAATTTSLLQHDSQQQQQNLETEIERRKKQELKRLHTLHKEQGAVLYEAEMARFSATSHAGFYRMPTPILFGRLSPHTLILIHKKVPDHKEILEKIKALVYPELVGKTFNPFYLPLCHPTANRIRDENRSNKYDARRIKQTAAVVKDVVDNNNNNNEEEDSDVLEEEGSSMMERISNRRRQREQEDESEKEKQQKQEKKKKPSSPAKKASPSPTKPSKAKTAKKETSRASAATKKKGSASSAKTKSNARSHKRSEAKKSVSPKGKKATAKRSTSKRSKK